MHHLYMLFKVRGNHSLKKSHYDDWEETRREKLQRKVTTTRSFPLCCSPVSVNKKASKTKKSHFHNCVPDYLLQTSWDTEGGPLRNKTPRVANLSVSKANVNCIKCMPEMVSLRPSFEDYKWPLWLKEGRFQKAQQIRMVQNSRISHISCCFWWTQYIRNIRVVSKDWKLTYWCRSHRVRRAICSL